jgi:hypothetical protein
MRVFRIIQLAAVGVFLGRAWQHIYWDAPYRSLLWDEEWMRWPVENLLGRSWQDYVTDVSTDQFIQQLVVGLGWFYVLCALAAIFVLRLGKWGRGLLWLGTISLIILAALYCKEKFFFIGQFFEYTLQFSIPVVLALVSQKPDRDISPRLLFFLKIAIALTFTCHGLYAIGYYPRPGNFVSMTMAILHVNEDMAVQVLNVAGVLDFMVSILIFLPGKWLYAGLAWAIIWGFLTAMARIVAHFYLEIWDDVLLRWLHESVIRVPHFLVPLALWFYDKRGG